MILKQALRIMLGLCIVLPTPAIATENLPRLPFGQTAVLPMPGQFILTPLYTYNYWKTYWKNGASTGLERIKEDGFDHNTGVVNVQYGVSRKVSADLTVGFTSAATRAFSMNRSVDKTSGLTDIQFGVNYQLLMDRNESWQPNLTLRTGGIIAGTYEKDFPFAPGDGGSGADLSFTFSKRLFDFGLGVYGTGGWRIRDNSVPQTFYAMAGANYTYVFGKKIQNLTASFGYHHLQDIDGRDIRDTTLNVPGFPPKWVIIDYGRDVREVIRGIEGGLGVTTRGGWRWQYYMEYPIDGANTPQKVLYGLYVSIPLGGK